MMKFSIFTVILLLSVFGFSQDQQPPIPVEVFGGHSAVSYQHVISKDIFNNKFNFFNVAAFDAKYSDNKNSVFAIQSLVFYKIGKGFSVGLGAQLQNVGAFSLAGIQYSYASDKLLVVILPTVNLNEKTNYEQFVLVEYRPKLNDKTRIYSRIQILANTDFEKYNRGYQQLRLGLEKKGLQFGVAATFDQFNSNIVKLENYGVFVRKLIF